MLWGGYYSLIVDAQKETPLSSSINKHWNVSIHRFLIYIFEMARAGVGFFLNPGGGGSTSTLVLFSVWCVI